MPGLNIGIDLGTSTVTAFAEGKGIVLSEATAISYDSFSGDIIAIGNSAMDMTEKEIHQAVEGLYHNLNTLQSRSGNQLPFTSINYGTCTLPEGRMITQALLEVLLEGLGSKKKTSIFPCGIFQSSAEINRYPGTPNYDLYQLALRCTATRLYPNYANIDWSGNVGYDPKDPTTYFSTMGCRTANGWDVNGLGQQKDGRGNICPVTIIMPTIAMEAPHIPITAVKPLYTTVNGVALIIKSSGANTKMYGTMNAAIASFAALTPVRMGFAPAIPAPANAANATGGVTAATIPK